MSWLKWNHLLSVRFWIFGFSIHLIFENRHDGRCNHRVWNYSWQLGTRDVLWKPMTEPWAWQDDTACLNNKTSPGAYSHSVHCKFRCPVRRPSGQNLHVFIKHFSPTVSQLGVEALGFVTEWDYVCHYWVAPGFLGLKDLGEQVQTTRPSQLSLLPHFIP